MEEIIQKGIEWIVQNPLQMVSLGLLTAGIPLTVYATIGVVREQNKHFREQKAIEERNRLECMDCPSYASGISPCEKYFKD